MLATILSRMSVSVSWNECGLYSTSSQSPSDRRTDRQTDRSIAALSTESITDVPMKGCSWQLASIANTGQVPAVITCVGERWNRKLGRC